MKDPKLSLSTVGRYKIIAPLGHGGVGTVFLAEDSLEPERRVALKRLRYTDRHLAERLRQEYVIARMLRHPHLAAVYDYEAGDEPYFTAEWIEGETLAEYFAKGAPLEDLPQLLDQLCDALTYIHDHGLLHLDIKPANLLITGQPPQLKLIDFGAASHARLSQTESNAGTIGFAAPERFAGEHVDARTDLFSVGVTIEHVLKQRPQPTDDLWKDLKSIAERLMSTQPYRRFQTARQLKQVLSKWCQPAAVPNQLSIPLESIHFIGRQVERSELQRLATNGGFGILYGESGVGKTRLLQEVRFWAQTQSMQWLDGTASFADGWSQLLRAVEALTTPLETNSDSGNAEMFMRLYQRLAETSKTRPWVFCYDAIEGIDPTLGRWLRFLKATLGNNTHRPAITVLLADRSIDVLQRQLDPHREWLIDTQTAVIELTGFVDVADSETLIKDVRPQLNLDALFLQQLHHRTGGKPGHLLAYAAVLHESNAAKSSLPAAPSSITAELKARRDRLPQEVINDLAQLSVLALPVPAELLPNTATHQAATLPSIDQGLAAQLLRHQSYHHKHYYGFASEDLRQQFLALLDKEATTQALRLWANALEPHLNNLPTEYSALFLSMLITSGQIALAEQQLLAICKQLMAEKQWRRTRDLLQIYRDHAREDANPKLVFAVTLLQAEIYQQTGEQGLALQHYWQGCESELATPSLLLNTARLATQVGQFELVDQLEIRLSQFNANALEQSTFTAITAEALAMQNRHAAALEKLGSIPPESYQRIGHEVRVRIHNTAGLCHYFLADYPAALSQLQQAMRVGKGGASQKDLLVTYNRLGLVYKSLGEASKAVDYFQRGLQRAIDLFDFKQQCSLQINLGTLYQEGGELKLAMGAYQDAQQSAERLGDRINQMVVLLNRANLWLFFGAVQEAQEALNQVLRLSDLNRSPQFRMAAHAIYGQLELEHGRQREARRHTLLALRLARQQKRSFESSLYLLQLTTLIGKGPGRQKVEAYLKKLTNLPIGDSLLLGQIEQLRGNQIEALAYFESKTDPNHRDLAWQLHADLATQASDTASADHHWRAARIGFNQLLHLIPDSYRQNFEQAPLRRERLRFIEDFHSTSLDSLNDFRTAQKGQVAVVLELAQKLSETLDQKVILDLVLEMMLKITHAKRGHILIQEDKDLVTYAHVNPLAGQAVVSHSLARQVMYSGRPFFTQNTQIDERLAKLTTTTLLPTTPLLCLPLKFRGKPIGAAYIEEPQLSQKPSGELLNLLLTLGSQASTAVATARQHERLQRQNRQIRSLNESLAKNLRDREQALAVSESLIAQQRKLIESGQKTTTLVTQNRAMLRILETVARVAASQAPILITGETGSGKELVAQRVHELSPRHNKPYYSINCAAFNTQLLESELFGHEPGSFTGAKGLHRGIFEVANGGTIFLDELGDMPVAMQPKLLRVLESGEFRRVGGNTTLKTQVRIVAATNVALPQKIKSGEFREDLWYRLNTVTLELPALRDRSDDIPHLVAHFVARSGKPNLSIAPETMQLLKSYTWPGNIRELRNEIERAAIFADNVILPQDLAPHIRKSESRMEILGLEKYIEGQVGAGRSYKSIIAELESVVLQTILKKQDLSRGELASKLGLARKTLYNKLRGKAAKE